MAPSARTYIPRIVDREIERRLSYSGAVVIEGPKASGKTATARRHARSEVLLDVDPTARDAIALDASLVLDGATPRLIDEWQTEPSIWNHVRRAIDDRGEPGQFILTGAAVPADDIVRHTGAGRLSRLRMRPLTLFESGESNGAVSLSDLVNGAPVRAADPGFDASRLATCICRGGWPGMRHLETDAAISGVRDYLDEIRRTDIRRVDGRQRDPESVGRMLRSLAPKVATEAPATTVAADIGGDDGPLHPETVRDYLDALARLMVVEDQPAWAPHLRSRSILRRSPKRHFVDPSLAAAALRAGPDVLLRDLELFGLLFESLVIRDLRVHSQPLDGTVVHYRDNTGLEVDAIVQFGDGRWGAIEIKLSPARIDEAATSLASFRERVDTRRMGEPAFLAVIVGTGYGYLRNDGIGVIPIGVLGP